jgi:hypothetical protein
VCVIRIFLAKLIFNSGIWDIGWCRLIIVYMLEYFISWWRYPFLHISWSIRLDPIFLFIYFKVTIRHSVLDYTNLCIVTWYWITQTSVLSLGIRLRNPLYCHSVLDYTNLCIVTRYWITQTSVLSLGIGQYRGLRNPIPTQQKVHDTLTN